MLPTYQPGTIIFGLRLLSPKVGSVVVASLDGLEIIKRVVRMCGEEYFLQGDNAEASSDSRKYGWFPREAIKSVVIGSIKQ
jgi:type IV secretory pathway protease TraF